MDCINRNGAEKGSAEPAGVCALRTLVASIGELQTEAARAHATRQVQQLALDLPLKDLVVRVLQTQRSLEGLIDTVTALAGLLDSAATPSPEAAARPLPRLPVWGDEERDAHFVTVPTSDVVYAFTASAIAQRLIGAGWLRQVPWERCRVYVRVDRSRSCDARGIGVLATPYHTLAELRGHVDPERVMLLNQSVVARLDHIKEIDAREPAAIEVMVALTGHAVEALKVSRRCWGPLRVALGLPARVRGRHALVLADR